MFIKMWDILLSVCLHPYTLLVTRIIYFIMILLWQGLIDPPHIPANNGAESRSGGRKIQGMYENVNPDLILLPLLVWV